MKKFSPLIFFKALLLTTLLLFSFSFVNATDFYVSINGNDNAGNGTAVNPWRTLRHAVTRVAPSQGHRIILSAGTFVESGRVDLPEGVSLIGAGKGVTTITANSGFYRSYYSGFDHNLFLLKLSGGDQILKGFTLDGANKNIYGGISVTYATDVEIFDIKIQGFYFCGLWLWDVRNSSFHDSETYDNSWSSSGWGGGGIHIYKLYDFSFYNLHLKEVAQREGTKGGGVAIKALGPGSDNVCENVRIENCDVDVHPYGPWNNGQAPNISIEFWNVDTKNCVISNSIIRQHISLVSINDQQNAPMPEGEYRFRIVDNDLISVGSYPIEISMNNIEVGHNYIDAAWTGYGIANWERRGTLYENWYIHHNVFTKIASGWPSSVIQSRGGLKNLQFVNNTIHLEGPPVGIYAPYGPNVSQDITIANNIFLRTNLHDPYTEPAEDWLIYPRTNEGIHRIENVAITDNIFHGFPQKLSTYISGLTQSGNQTVDPQLNLTGEAPFPFYEPKEGSIANILRAGARYNENNGITGVDSIPEDPELILDPGMLDLPIRINAGGEAFVSAAGTHYLSDTLFEGESRTATHMVDISDATLKSLYQSERWGKEFSYRFNVPNGKYSLRLHFAEIYWGVAEKRIMDVLVQDSLLLDDMDVFLEGGGKNQAFQKVFEGVEVTDNVLTLAFSASADNAKISGIEIEWENNAPAFALSAYELSLEEDFDGTHVIDVVPDTVHELEADQIVTYRLEPEQGNIAQIAIDSASGQVVVSAIPDSFGTETFTVVADDGQDKNSTFEQSFTLQIAEDSSKYLSQLTKIRINSGGPSYTTTDGVEFAEDDGSYVGGTSRTYISTAEIAETEDDAIYQSERWGNAFSYNFPVPEGTYDVILHFSEIYWQIPARRVLSVDIEGGEIEVPSLDLVSEVGAFTAYQHTIQGVEVSDGEMNLDFTTLKDNAKIAAIEVIELEKEEAGEVVFDPVLRLNCGSEDDVVVDGEVFSKDTYFSSNTHSFTSSQIDDILGTDWDVLYLSERYADSDKGTFTYNIPVEEGKYRIKLHFAEIYFGAKGGLESVSGEGRRSIGVELEGSPILSELDLVSEVGSMTAYVHEADIEILDGELTLDFSATKDRPKISAIEVYKERPVELTTLRINAGGKEPYTIGDLVFQPDTFFSEGSLHWRNDQVEDISGTAADELYLTERFADQDQGIFSYDIPVVNGEYVLYLHFSEIYFGVKGGLLDKGRGERLIDVSVEEVSVIESLDVVGEVGSGTALIQEIPVEVKDGVLNIDLGSSKNRAKLSAIELLPADSINSALVYQDFRNSIRINAGSSETKEFGGYTFIADTFYTANTMSWHNEFIMDVKGTEHDDLYRSERFSDRNQGEFSYQVPVEDGDYVVYLHFAEIYFGSEGGWPNGAQGQRVFNVSVEGEAAIEELDLYYEVGAMYAYVQEVRTTVTDGVLNIDLGSTQDRAKISAIEILIPSEADQSVSRIASENRTFATGNTLKERSHISLAPNPAVNTVKLLVESEAWEGFYEVVIYDSRGRRVQYYQFDKPSELVKQPLNIEDLLPGLYVVNVVFQGESVSQKLWKADR